jgi:hypothetical protein
MDRYPASTRLCVVRQAGIHGSSKAIAAMMKELPPVVDPSAPLSEIAALGQQLGRLGTLHDEIAVQQREDLRRVRELSERATLTDRERREAEACIQRLLDGERAADTAREWWEENMPGMQALMKRAGGEDLAELAARMQPSSENLELRAWLRRARASLRMTWQARLKRQVARRLATVLVRSGRVVQDFADRHSEDDP